MLEIKTYNNLNSHLDSFKKKKINFLIIVSEAGLGKSYNAQETLIEESPFWVDGFITPLKLYTQLLERNEEEKDFIVVFDDVLALFQNRKNISLLLALCDTKEEKSIKYLSSASSLKNLEGEFETSCKVIMLYNELKPESPVLKALFSRATIIHFNPSSNEILENIKTWGEDKTIISFLEKFAPFSTNLNLRIYKRAEELRKSNLQWKDEILNELKIDKRLLLLEEILKNKKLKTDQQREKYFAEKEGGSRSRYYHFKKLFFSKNPQYEKSR